MFPGVHNVIYKILSGGNAGKANGGRRDGAIDGAEEISEEKIDYAKIAARAVGHLGVSYSEFWDLSLLEYAEMQKGLVERADVEYKREYEVTRFGVYLLLFYNERIKTSTEIPDIFPFPWEEKKSEKKQSVEEMKRQIQKMALTFGTKPKQEKIAPKKE